MKKKPHFIETKSRLRNTSYTGKLNPPFPKQNRRNVLILYIFGLNLDAVKLAWS